MAPVELEAFIKQVLRVRTIIFEYGLVEVPWSPERLSASQSYCLWTRKARQICQVGICDQMPGLNDVIDDIGFGSIHLHQFDDILQKFGGLVAFKFHLVWYLLAINCVIVMDLTWRQHPFNREDLPFLHHLDDVAL